MSHFEIYSQALTKIGFLIPLLVGGVLQVETVQAAGPVSHYAFEEYRVNSDPAPSMFPSDGYKIEPAENWPNYPDPAGSTPNDLFIEFLKNDINENNRLFAHNQAIVGSFSSDVPWGTVPQTGRSNSFSWDISQDIDTSLYPGADPTAPRDLYDVPQDGDNTLRPWMSDTSEYTFEVSFKQSIQRGFQALIGRDYTFQDSIENAPAGSDRANSPLGAFFLGLAANDEPGESQETRIHFYTFDTDGNLTSTFANQTGNPYHGVGPVIQPEVWYDLAAIGDGEDVTLYLKESTELEFSEIASLSQLGLNHSDLSAGWSLGRAWHDFTDDGVVNGGPAHGFRGWMDEVRISNTALSVGELLATPPVEYLAGDFDQDGFVDGSDFLTWQRGFGLTEQLDNSNGDADGDGTVDGLDLVLWESQFGSNAAIFANTVVIPEPTSVALIVIGSLLFSIGSRSKLRA